MGSPIAREGNEGAPLGLASGRLDRRSFLFGSAASLGALGLAGCATSDGMIPADMMALYGPAPNEKFPIPAVDLSKVDPKYFRRTVRYDSKEAPGTIIIDPANYYVYRIEGDGNATRYGANVSRPGFLWSGDAYVGRKAEWPTWTPPKEMIQRQPEARKYAGGMPGGLDNPLGARTLYLYQNGRYTVCTIYSTSDPDTIGNGHYERLYRPPQSGHDRPLFTNADQDESGHAAGIANGVNPGPGAAGAGSAKKCRSLESPFARVVAIVGGGGHLSRVRATPLRTFAALLFPPIADRLELAFLAVNCIRSNVGFWRKPRGAGPHLPRPSSAKASLVPRRRAFG